MKEIDPTEMIKLALQKSKISFEDGKNILSEILTSESHTIGEIYYAFKNIMKMRNDLNGQDVITSPVKNSNGIFFDTRNDIKGLPKDADANGAYHIALKGALMLKQIEKDYDPSSKIVLPKTDLTTWLKFTQTRGKHD